MPGSFGLPMSKNCPFGLSSSQAFAGALPDAAVRLGPASSTLPARQEYLSLACLIRRYFQPHSETWNQWFLRGLWALDLNSRIIFIIHYSSQSHRSGSRTKTAVKPRLWMDSTVPHPLLSPNDTALHETTARHTRHSAPSTTGMVFTVHIATSTDTARHRHLPDTPQCTRNRQRLKC